MPGHEGAEHDGTEHEGAGHEGAGYDGAGHDGTDALLAALTDDPLPAAARQDAAFMAEHRSAVADLALLRDQLRLMGDTLAAAGPDAGPRAPRPAPRPPRASAPPSPPHPTGPHRPRRPGRHRRYAGAVAGALVLAAGTALLGGLVWLGAQGGSHDTGAGGDAAASKQEDGAGAALSDERRLACAKVLVEGTVRSVTPAGAGTVRVVLEVTRSYRPERTVADRPTVAVTLPQEAREDLAAGTYALVRVPVHARDRADWETGPGVADARRGIVEALPGARGMTCPDPGGDHG